MADRIDGAQLKKAMNTPQMMMSLFNESIRMSYFSLNRPITLDTAIDLCRAVKKVIYGVEAPTNSYDSKDNNNNNINNINSHVPNIKGWRKKHIDAWTCEELQGWIFGLKHLGIGIQFQIMEE
eukprot:194069_1